MSSPHEPEPDERAPALAEDTAAAGRRRAPSRRVTVLAGLVLAAALAGLTRATWARAVGPDLTGTSQQVEVSGADAAPAVLALAIVAVAASLATSLSSRWVRFVTGPVLIASGIGTAISALMVTVDPQQASGAAVAQATGIAGGEVRADATAWPLFALAPALGLLVTGCCVVLVGGSWPLGSRYRSAAVTTAADPAEDPAAAWDALTRGEDPSGEEEPAPTRRSGRPPGSDGDMAE